MPRFYFDIVKDGETNADADGTELPSLESARRAAGRCAGEIIAFASKHKLPERWDMNVRDDLGQVLATLSFTSNIPRAA